MEKMNSKLIKKLKSKIKETNINNIKKISDYAHPCYNDTDHTIRKLKLS